MMAGFLTPQQTTEEIVASVLDGIISDVERKAKNRARKKRQKAKKKRDKEYSWFMRPKEHQAKDKHFYITDGDLDSNSSLELSYSIAKRTEDELKPLGYKFVDFYDTIFYDECEKPLLKYVIKTMNGGATMSKIPSVALEEVGKKFCELTDRLPKDVIIYCDPSYHNFSTMMLSFHFNATIAMSSIYLIWVNKAEHFHYARVTDTPQSFYNSQIKLIVSKRDFSETRMVECPICMEEKKLAYDSEECEVSTSRCCGKEVCDDCMNHFLIDKSKFRFINRPNGKKAIEITKPEYTCPLCRGGYFHPDDPRKISDEWLRGWSDAVSRMNGEEPEEEKKEDLINKQFMKFGDYLEEEY